MKYVPYGNIRQNLTDNKIVVSEWSQTVFVVRFVHLNAPLNWMAYFFLTNPDMTYSRDLILYKQLKVQT